MTSLAEAFNPRHNSIGFLRWLMAFMVIFSHAGPIAGFYGGQDLGVQWSDEQSFGGVAVAGFFFLSGFLITRSKMGSTSTVRYFWHRFLRIYPGFFLILLVTAFVFAPLAWIAQHGSIDGFWSASPDSPWTYFSRNFTLVLGQLNIAGLGTETPLYTDHGFLDWNGSAWTLAFEFGAYILVALLGIFGALANRMIGGIIAVGIIGLSTMQWLNVGDLPGLSFLFQDYRMLLLMAPFAWGMLFCLFRDKVPIDDRIAIACLIVAVLTYTRGGWLLVGQYAFCYVLLWFGIRVTKLANWDKRGDLSYGIYISGWPIMWLATFYNLQEWGWLAYHVIVIIACHIYAFLSYHLVEKPAMSLKRWTPRSALWVLRKTERQRASWHAFVDRRFVFTKAGAR